MRLDRKRRSASRGTSMRLQLHCIGAVGRTWDPMLLRSRSDWSQATTLRTYHLAVIPSVAFTESLGAQAAPQVHSSGLCARLYLLLGSLRRPWRLTRKNHSGLHTLQQGDLPPMQLDRCHAAMQVPDKFPRLANWHAEFLPHFSRSTAARPLPETWRLGGSHHLSGVRAVPGRPPPPSTLARAASKMSTTSLLW